MSANPEAFDYLRKAAYQFVQKHGKDANQLHARCLMALAEWRNGEGAGSGLTDAEAAQIIDDVTRWTITKYNPPRRKAKRHREERAATEMTAPVLLEYAAETFGAATVRNAARISGQSKSTIARHLRQQGIAPRRQKKIDALPARVKWLVQILDATFNRDMAGLLMTDDLAAAIWDNAVEPLPKTAPSTMSTRRRKLPEYLAAVNASDLGFHLIRVGDVVAVRRGRRLPGMKDTAIWVDDQRKLNGIHAVVLPCEKLAETAFWSDPWLQDVIALFEIGYSPWFTDPSELEPLLRLTRPLLDARPLYHLFDLAIRKGYKGDFVEDLSALAERVVDPTTRKGAFNVAYSISWLSAHRDWDPHPIDALNDAMHHLKFMARIRTLEPDSYQRIQFFKSVILEAICENLEDDADRVPQVLRKCRELAALEKQGEWQAPSAAELARFHPDAETFP